MNKIIILSIFLSLIVFPNMINQVSAQNEITVNGSTPCFLDVEEPYKIWQDCNARDDPLKFTMIGWEWITGGLMPALLVGILIIAIYKKYNEPIYPVFIGLVFLPISFMYFPAVFVSWAIIMAFVAVGIWIWYAIVMQTR